MFFKLWIGAHSCISIIIPCVSQEGHSLVEPKQQICVFIRLVILKSKGMYCSDLSLRHNVIQQSLNSDFAVSNPGPEYKQIPCYLCQI